MTAGAAVLLCALCMFVRRSPKGGENWATYSERVSLIDKAADDDGLSI